MAHRKNLQSRLAKLTNFYQSLNKDADPDAESGSEASWEPDYSDREAAAVPRSSVSIVRNRRSYAEPTSPPPEQEFPGDSGADVELYRSTLQVGDAARDSGSDMDAPASPQLPPNATRAPRSPQDPRAPRSPQSPHSPQSPRGAAEKTFGQFRSSAFVDKAGRGGARSDEAQLSRGEDEAAFVSQRTVYLKPAVNLLNPPAKYGRPASADALNKPARNDAEEEHKTEKTIRLMRPQRDRPTPSKPAEGVEAASGEPHGPGSASQAKDAPKDSPGAGPRGGSVSYATYQGAVKLKKRPPRPTSKSFDDNGSESPASAGEANNSEDAAQPDAARAANGADRSKVLRKTPGRLPRAGGKEDGEAVRSLKAKATTVASSEQGDAGQPPDGQGNGRKEVVIEETEIVTIEEIVTPKDKVGPGFPTGFDGDGSQSVKTQISQHTKTKKTVVVQGNRTPPGAPAKAGTPPSSPKEKDADAGSGPAKARANARDRRPSPFSGGDGSSRAPAKGGDEANQRSPVISRKTPTSKPAEAKPTAKPDKVLSGDSETKPKGGLNSTPDKAGDMPEECAADWKAPPGSTASNAASEATRTPAGGSCEVSGHGDAMGANLPVQTVAKDKGDAAAANGVVVAEGGTGVAGVSRQPPDGAADRGGSAVAPGSENAVIKTETTAKESSPTPAATATPGSDSQRAGAPAHANEHARRPAAEKQLEDGETSATPVAVTAAAPAAVSAAAAETGSPMDFKVEADLRGKTGSDAQVISSILDAEGLPSAEQTQSPLKAGSAAEPSQDINSVESDARTQPAPTGASTAASAPLLSDTGGGGGSSSETHVTAQGEPSQQQHVEAGSAGAEQAAGASIEKPSFGAEDKAPQQSVPSVMGITDCSSITKPGTQLPDVTDRLQQQQLKQQQQQQQQLKQQQQQEQQKQQQYQEQQQQQAVANAVTAEPTEVSAGSNASPVAGQAGETARDEAPSPPRASDGAAVPAEQPGSRRYLPGPAPAELCPEVEVIEDMFQNGSAAADSSAANGERPSRHNPAFEPFLLLSPIKEEDLEEEGDEAAAAAGGAGRQRYFPCADAASGGPKPSPLAEGFAGNRDAAAADDVAPRDEAKTGEAARPPDDPQSVSSWAAKSGGKSELPSVDFQKTKTMNLLKEQIKNRSLKSTVGHQSLHNGFGKDRAPGQLGDDAEGGAASAPPHNKFSSFYKQSSLSFKGFDAGGPEARGAAQTPDPAGAGANPKPGGGGAAAREGPVAASLSSPRDPFASAASAMSQPRDVGAAVGGAGRGGAPAPPSGHAAAFDASWLRRQPLPLPHASPLDVASRSGDATPAEALRRGASGDGGLLPDAPPGAERLLPIGGFADLQLPGVLQQGPPNGDQNPEEEGERKVNPRPGKMVIFYEPGFTGKKIELFSDVPDATEWDLPTTISLRVVRGGWLVYREPGFTGECFALEEGEEEMTDPWGEGFVEEQGVGPMPGTAGQGSVKEADEPALPKIVIGSIKRVVKNHSIPEIVLFSEEGFRGTDIIVSDDAEKVEVYGMQPSVNSIVINSGVWLLYLGYHYVELISILEPGEYPTMECWDGIQPRIGSLRPLKMGEIKVERPNEAKVILYEKPNFEGQHREVFLENPSLAEVFGGDSAGGVASIRIPAGVWVGYEGPEFTGRQYILEEGEYCSWQEWGGCNESLASIRPIFADFAEPRVLLLEQPGSPEGRELSVEGDSLPDVQAVGYAPTTTSVSVERGVWIAFELEDFMGQMFVLEKGFYATPADWGGHSPTLASIRPIRLERSVEMTSKARMELYSQRDFAGMHLAADADFKALPDGWTTMGSARVLKGCWVLYSNEDFSGREFILEEGCYSSPESFFSFDAQIKSLRPIPIVFSEPSISLFSHEDLRGREMVLEEATPSLDPLGGGGCVRSLHVHGGLWVAFEFPNFQGRQLLLEPSETPDWKQRSSWGRLGSIRPLKQSGVCVRVRNQGQEGVLTVHGDLADPRGVSVCLLPDCGKSTQLWLFQDGFLRSLASEACLEVVGGMVREGTRVVLWPEHGKPQQRWYIDSDGTIGSRLRDDLVLDIQGSGIVDRNQAVIMLRNQHRRSQLWQLEVQ